jgi:hypothetical protein
VSLAAHLPEAEPGARLDHQGEGDAAAGHPAAWHGQLRFAAGLCAAAHHVRAAQLPADAQTRGHVEAQGAGRRAAPRPLAAQSQRQGQVRLPQRWQLEGNLPGIQAKILSKNSRFYIFLLQHLKMIALSERHPPPEMCNGVNFKELYYYLATIFGGTHPK